MQLACFKAVLNVIKRFLSSNTEDVLVLSGLAIIVVATFLLSKIAGLYCLGVCLIVIAKFPAGKG